MGARQRERLRRWQQRGQGMVEYALILVLIAVVCIVVIRNVGQSTQHTFSCVASNLDQAGQSGSTSCASVSH